MRWYAATQFEWQSSSVPTTPPLSMPGNASYCGSGRHSHTTSSPTSAGKLRTCSPRSFAGPHPKHALPGA